MTFPTQDALPFPSMTPLEIRISHGLPRKTKHDSSSMKRGEKGLIPSHGNCVSILFRRRRRVEAHETATALSSLIIDLKPRKKIRLKDFGQLPLELVFEIYSYLHPLEIYDLLRSCRAFRDVLTSKQSQVVWKTAYDAHSDIPPCPEDMSYPSWTTLLFGPDICYKCDSKRSRVDFVFRWKLCQQCWDEIMQPLPEEYPFTSKEMFSRNQLRSIHKPDYYTQLRYLDSPKFFLKEDIRKLSEEIAITSKPGETDPVRLSAYHDRQKLLAEKIQEKMECASVCDIWVTLVMQELETTMHSIIVQILRRWKWHPPSHETNPTHPNALESHDVDRYRAVINQIHGVRIEKRAISYTSLHRHCMQSMASCIGGDQTIPPPMDYKTVAPTARNKVVDLLHL